MPVVAVLHRAVIGGGLELAAAGHIRVAERSAYYALPEATRGIFVGGGDAVRIPRLIGTTRMIDMMLTGRTYSAEEGLGNSERVDRDCPVCRRRCALEQQIEDREAVLPDQIMPRAVSLGQDFYCEKFSPSGAVSTIGEIHRQVA